MATETPTSVEPRTPNQDATIQMIRGVVQEMFKELAPVFKDMALTPEKLREANKPYIDPLKLARELRESQKQRVEDEQNRKNKEERQRRCTHKDKNLKWSIRLQHNFHDNMPRGICPLCEILIEPAHWDYRPTTERQKDGSFEKAVVVKEHPLYHIVQEIEAMSG